MTVLHSLLSTFRNSRSTTGQRLRRSRANRYGALSGFQAESLEQRLVLSGTTPEYAPGRVLVGFDANAFPGEVSQPEGVDAIETIIPGSTMSRITDFDLYRMDLPQGVTVAEAVTLLRGATGVSYVEPDWYAQTTAVPNDPDYASLMWSLNNTGQTVNGVTGTPGADISAELAWDTAVGSTNTIVAIVDSGVDFNHPDLASNIWVNAGEIAGNGIDDDNNGFIDDVNGWDFGSNDNDPDDDLVGHGTHVAGTAGAVGDNGVGLTGVNWNVSIMPLKIADDVGGLTFSAAAQAINYAVNNGATVSNHSYRGFARSQALENAIIFAQQNNHIVVAAAGNDTLDIDFLPAYPAAFPQDNVVSVAATDQNDNLAGFSNFGVSNVDIGAPGVNIWSTTPRAGSQFYGPDYDFSDGTSMASPHVAGAIGLLQSIATSAPYIEIIRALYDGADPIPSLNNRVGTGARLNLAGAVAQLREVEILVTPGSIREDAGAGAASITVRKVGFPLDMDMTVVVSFTDDSEVAVPLFAGATSATVTVPAGDRELVIPIDILDDTLLDGTQTVAFTVELAGQLIDTALLDVTDHETLTLTIDKPTLVEDGSDSPATLTVTRSNTDIDAPNTWVTISNELREYDPSGAFVGSVPIPWPAGGRPVGEDAHDAVFLQNGRIAVFNGTTEGYISVYDPAGGTWQDFTIPGLSTDGAGMGTGGITSVGNFVFVTDMSSGAADPFGIVRLNLNDGTVTRFADRQIGDRLFVNDIFSNAIQEVDPLTGVTVNTLPLPVTNSFGSNTGLAFDGTNLWVLAGPLDNDRIYQLNPDTGTVLDVHQLGDSTRWDGLAYLNGLLYVQDSAAQNRIAVYDPVLRQVVRRVFAATPVGNGITGGLAAIRSPDSLFATSAVGDLIYEIDPTTGAIRNTWSTGSASTEYGLAVLSGEIYVGEAQSADVKVFNRDGNFQRSLTLSLTSPPGVYALAGDDVQGLAITALRYRDVSGGLDGKLYGLDQAGTTVGRFNATTLALEEHFDLAVPVQSITVAANGMIYGAAADGMIHEFDAAGALLRSLDSGVTGLTDIDVNIAGKIMFSSVTGTVGETSVNFEAPTTYSVGGSTTFVTFGRHFSRTGGEAIVQLNNSDPSELAVPAQIVIPAGQASASIQISAVDDNLFDGDQTVTVSPVDSQYQELFSDDVVVIDFEGVVVNVLAGQIGESAGIGATTVQVSRTYVDGPFTWSMAQSADNTQALPIPDFTIIESHITIPDQISQITDLDVRLSLTHTWLQDLDVFLVSPSGTTVELFTDQGNNGTEMTNLILDDEALIRIADGSAPYTGRFRPERYPTHGLNLFDGENPSGTWTLVIRDDNQQATGTLLNWGLDFTTIGLAPLTVTLTSDDISEAGFGGENGPSSTIEVLIPANQAIGTVSLDAIDDHILDGTRTVTISASGVTSPDNSVNLNDLDLGSDTVDVTDVELLELTLSASTISESAGANALTGTVTRLNTGDAPFANPLTVTLMSSDTSELTVLGTVTIPAGQASASFDITAVDDADFDGDIEVTISASATGFSNTPSQVVTVTDHEPAIVLSTPSTTIAENGGSLELLVRRVNALDISSAVTVTLTSSDVSELSFNGAASTTVTIPANSTGTTVTVTVEDDALLDGSQVATLDASGAGINPGTLDITVEDHEVLTVTLSHTSFLENGGTGPVTGTVTVSNTDDRSQPLTVTLTSSDLTAATIPVTVTIPANATSAQFTVTPVNDTDIDGDQPVTFTATAAGYLDGTVNATVQDHEPPVLTGPGFQTLDATPTITWEPLPGATRYDLWVNYLSGGVNQIIRVQDVQDSSGQTATSYTPPAELGLGRYRAWVRAYDAQEVAGFWSVGHDFLVTTPPVITAPAESQNMASSVFPEITWSDVVDVTRYDLWVSNLTTGESPFVRVEDLLTSNFQTPQALPGGEYRAWVRAFGPMDSASVWSMGRTFAVLATPEVISPSGGTSNRTPQFEWDPVEGADHYEIWISNRDTGSVVVRDRFVPEASYSPLSDLADQRHVVWVRAISERGFVSQWSPATNFIVAGDPELGQPVITSPVNDATTGRRPEFAWTEIAGVDHYEIWVNRLDVPTGRVIHENDLTTNSYAATADLAPGEYRVWVRALSDSGEVSEWSAAVDFLVVAVDASAFGTPNVSGPAAILTSVFPQSAATNSHNLIAVEHTTVPAMVARVSSAPAAESRDATPPGTRIEHAEASHAADATTGMDGSATKTAQSPTVEAFDEVMADWDSATWWTENSDDASEGELSLAGLGLGIVATGTLRRDGRVRRNRR